MPTSAATDQLHPADRLLPGATVRLVAPDGSRVTDPRAEPPPPEVARALLRAMVLGRRFDEQATTATRQGRLAVYPSSRGQEACQVGAALALAADDWLFPTYRDSVALVARGIDPLEVLTLLRGDWHCGYDVARQRTAAQCTPLATNALHAVGMAHALAYQGRPQVALALLGDGATSEGDTHEALNFAAVMQAPVVFLVQNNGFAISVPVSKQTRAPSLAHKGVGYGIPGVLVDGNDALAVSAVLAQAVSRARSGGGPTLVEALTYRMQAHTNADDASRYRTDADVLAWEQRDPVDRLRALLTREDRLSAADLASWDEEAEALASLVRTGLAEDVPGDPLEVFAHVYSTMTPALVEQRRVLAAELAADGGRRS